MAQTNQPTDGREWLVVLISVFFSMPFLFGYAISQRPENDWVTVFWFAMMISGAAYLAAFFLGFLFSLPRPRFADPTEEATESTSPRYWPNSNLVEISDWLTKIVAGLGLVQLASAPEVLVRFANAVAPGLGDLPSSAIFGGATLIWHLVTGFLSGYLVTRGFVARRLAAADAQLDQDGTVVSTLPYL